MQVLLIEDNPDHAELVMDTIQNAYSGSAEIDWHTELFPALALLSDTSLSEHHFDICLCDLQLPDSGIDETTTKLQHLDSYVPIVVLTSLDDEGKAKTLLQKGVQDYLSKEDLQPSHLYRTCTYAIERKRQTVQIENRNRDQAAFCYSLSHDFKGPLRRIGNLLDFLKDDLSERVELTEKEKEHFDAIHKNVGSVNALIGDLYQYLDLENSRENFVDVNLNEVIEEAQQLLGLADSHPAHITVSALPCINGNRAQLVILFKNLLDNAIKYCQGNPIVYVRMDVGPNDRFVLISVHDNGIGIAAEKIDRIFSPFQRLHGDSEYTGTGLGLSIVKRIIDNHQGRIQVQSELGKGTTITVSLPLVHALNV